MTARPVFRQRSPAHSSTGVLPDGSEALLGPGEHQTAIVPFGLTEHGHELLRQGERDRFGVLHLVAIQAYVVADKVNLAPADLPSGPTRQPVKNRNVSKALSLSGIVGAENLELLACNEAQPVRLSPG